MKKQAKLQKKLIHRFGALAGSMEAYYHHLDLRALDDLDDAAFAFIMEKVKGVNMLDLNETEITNESIALLTRLEYLKELRAKGCALDNGCITDLNRIPSLEFLHLKNTMVTLDGLLELKDLIHLKTLLFSAGEEAHLKEKMMQLHALHPDCQFIIDGKNYEFDRIELFLHAVWSVPYRYRLKLISASTPGLWSNWLRKPQEGYFETETQGVQAVKDIEWIEIDPVAEGLQPEQEVAFSTSGIEASLSSLGVPYLVADGVIRMYVV